MKTVCGFLTNPLCTQTLTQMASEMWPSRGWQECRPEGERRSAMGWNGVSVLEQSWQAGASWPPTSEKPGVRGDRPLAVPGTAVSPSTSTQSTAHHVIHPSRPSYPLHSHCFTLAVTVKFPSLPTWGVCHRIECFDFRGLKKLRIDSCLQVSYIYLLPHSSDGRVRLQCRRPGFNPWVRKIPWKRAWQSTLVFLPGESHGQRRLGGYSPWGHIESDTTEQLTHSTHKDSCSSSMELASAWKRQTRLVLMPRFRS